jgi:hypothetical protein
MKSKKKKSSATSEPVEFFTIKVPQRRGKIRRMSKKEAIETYGRLAVPLGGAKDLQSSANSLCSYLCHVTHGSPGEEWPISSKGEPLTPLMQIFLEELPAIPAHLQDLSLITVFLDWNEPQGLRNGEGWVLRAYSRKNVQLAPLSYIPDPRPAKGRRLVWGNSTLDMPPNADSVSRYHAAQVEHLYDKRDDLRVTLEGTKVGGYPTPLQWDIHFCDTKPNEKDIAKFGVSVVDMRIPNLARPQFAFQIASSHELDFHILDMGIMYFARGSRKRSEWFYMVESH